jgi:hypothetical protein
MNNSDLLKRVPGGSASFPPRMVHSNHQAGNEQATFAVPGFIGEPGKETLDQKRWHQPGVCVLKNGDAVYFCNCNSDGICARKAAEVQRALGCNGAETVNSGKCIHIDFVVETVTKSGMSPQEIIDNYTLTEGVSRILARTQCCK